ncbi:hypothetical protein ThrDRAFT_04321 [Frankia casuarinae]|uniref:2-polyprenyl-6-methoxyphenol hydroxylase and related FAD-dependent oxidoreductases-like n=1 Tax=Frankia casuarinae (strain DSM 45818 / CECT 9043 / HFP020203 / CcI3) TaxID=106370 RepID=Q2JBC5_FRACC|nr:2-polyprenyl-6-methoxyphenol hydroxylase and related FAD-dependent oxidoreductase-like protein [Frankia casuarinae]ABD11417.1 2-polyprenyl-6-methoxyphenol hydroxylase and related FAD-dependent oxidoreductases-like [Frankia casuarinae]EYT90059.1 hypothetical protein ThrDRAFT_04321 [Frankia casuarinae]
MKCIVLGAGPAGLAAAVAIRRRSARSAAVTVVERRKSLHDEGFGILLNPFVVAGHSAGGFAWASRVFRRFVRWNGISVFGRGQGSVTLSGHPGWAIARSVLISELRAEAESLGCEITCGRPAAPADLDDADLVIDARGARHDRVPDVSSALVRDSDDLFVWLSTRRAFDCLTFAFAEVDGHLLTAHAYTYRLGHSAFIVEGAAAAWRAARRLAPDETAPADAWVRTVCERLFADVLAGHALDDASPTVQRFRKTGYPEDPTRKSVQVGDRAHPVHFSVGLGTSLAIEDGIVLGDHVAKCRDPREAIVSFDEVRQVRTRRAQRLASRSAEWLSTVTNRWNELSTPELAWSLATRTGQGTASRLKAQDGAWYELISAAAARRTPTVRRDAHPWSPLPANSSVPAPPPGGGLPLSIRPGKLDASSRVELVAVLEAVTERDVLCGTRYVDLRVHSDDLDWAEGQRLAGRVGAIAAADLERGPW